MSTLIRIPKTLPTTFRGMVDLMAPHAIEDDADYDAVVELMNRLVLLPGHRTAGQEKYLETLAQLVEAYDRKHYPIDTSDISGLDLLRHLVDEHGMTASDLGRLLGNRALGSKVLNGTRQLSKAHMKALGEHFKMDPGAFL